MKQIGGLGILLLLALCVHAQQERIQRRVDSLIAVASTQPNDTQQCLRYCNISNSLRQLDPEKSIKWAQKGIVLSHTLQYLKGTGCAQNNLGISYYMQGKYAESIEAFKAYTQANQTMGDSVSIAWGYNNIGNVYTDLADYHTTLMYYDSALQIRQSLHDSGAIAQSMVNFGYVYKELGAYTEALVYLYQALHVLEARNDKTSLAYCYDFIGSVYALRKNYRYSNVFYEKALRLYVQADQRSGEAIALNTIGTNHYALGAIHLGKLYIQRAYAIYSELADTRQLAIISGTLSEIYTLENKPDSALLLAQQAIRYHELTHNTRQLGTAYLKAANAYTKLNRLREALVAAEKAYEIVQHSGERNSRREILQLLHKLYAQTGNFNKAYLYQQAYIQLNDSMVNASGERAIAEMQTKYETEKKDIAITKQGWEIKRKQTQLLFLLIAIVFILVVGIFGYNRYRLKQKALLSAALLHEQSLRNKAIIEAEEKERIRIARELHDGIGQQLSATKMNLSAFEGAIAQKDKETYNMLVQLVDDAVKEVRTVSHNMMPNALIRSGLSSAIRDFVHKLGSNDSLKVDLQIVGLNVRLESTTEAVLYRVLQECVSNIVKHARASHISIQLIKHTLHLNMIIEDNGRGFDTTKMSESDGIGLRNMISRVTYLNGTIEFDSTPGKGTTVIIDIPVV
jgi:two-component system NarL family sensor kinase